MSDTFKLPTPAWARDMHGETEVYTVDEVKDILAEQNKRASSLVAALERLTEIADAAGETYNTGLMDEAIAAARLEVTKFRTGK